MVWLEILVQLVLLAISEQLVLLVIPEQRATQEQLVLLESQVTDIRHFH
jgi:hypothetical protein